MDPEEFPQDASQETLLNAILDGTYDDSITISGNHVYNAAWAYKDDPETTDVDFRWVTQPQDCSWRH